MHNLRLSDDTYNKALRLAKSRGLESVEAYITEVVEEEIVSDEVGFDSFFTPRVLEMIDASYEEVKSGRVYTLDEADAILREHRREWLEKNPDSQSS